VPGTMLCRRAGKKCPGDYACLGSKKAVWCLRAWGQCLSGERGSNAVFEIGVVARLGRLLCLWAGGQCLSGERGSNALFVCLGTMLCRRARKQCPGDYACPGSERVMRCLKAARSQDWAACFVCALGDNACPGSGGAMLCLCAWGQCLSGERKSNALFECLGLMPVCGARKQCAV
jgi:hypothetical protein